MSSIKEKEQSPEPGAKTAPHKPLTEFYESPEARSRFLQGLFDRTAKNYDWISGVLSFGTDRSYRKRILRMAEASESTRLLDVATGTGLVADAALSLGVRRENLIGIDPSRGMLEENKKRRPIPLAQAFGEALPFADESFDLATMGYALRHVGDLGILFREIQRVLRPGGKVVILEISRPESKVATKALGFYMKRIVPPFVRLWTRNKDAGKLMEYYWETIAECVPPATILDALTAIGYADVKRTRFGPMLNEYWGRKPGTAE